MFAYVPVDVLRSIELESIDRGIVADVSQMELTEGDIQALLVHVEDSDLEPEQKFLAAHILFRIAEGKKIKKPEIPLMTKILGEEFANSLANSVFSE